MRADAGSAKSMGPSQDEAFEIFKDSGFVLVKDAPAAGSRVVVRLARGLRTATATNT